MNWTIATPETSMSLRLNNNAGERNRILSGTKLPINGLFTLLHNIIFCSNFVLSFMTVKHYLFKIGQSEVLREPRHTDLFVLTTIRNI